MKFPRASRKHLLGYLILHLVAAAIFVFVLTKTVRNQMVLDAREKMDSMSIMLARQLQTGEPLDDPVALQQYLGDIGAETNMRLSVIADDGSIIADSLPGAQSSGGASPPELVEARSDGVGFAKRHSAALDQQMLLFTRRIEGETSSESSPHKFVRVAVPVASIDSAIGAVQRNVWVFALALGALTAFLMSWLSANFLKPLELFSKAARNVGDGEYQSVPAVHHRDDEWGELGDAFEQMQTELSRREGRLVENSQRLEAVLSSMIEGVLAVEPNGDVMLANGAACRMLSFHREKLVGRKLTEVVRIPELTQAIETSQQERTFSKTEFKTIGDPSRTLKARVSMLADEEQPRVAVVLHDVTELRQLETMRQDFVANVSHELKTPLASIKAYAETLRMGAIRDESRNVQFLEQIEFQADTLNQQIQDLLQLARVESGEKTFSISDIDVNMICESLHRQFLDAALGRHLELHLQLSEPAPQARCDAEAIETVVKNLVVNAIHYTPEGGRVSISTKIEGRWVIVTVADTGIGIAKDQQSRVFERFYRVDKARSRDMGGTGLGLAIVKHLTQAFGGSVTLESQLGKGSKFHVRLPRSKT